MPTNNMVSPVTSVNRGYMNNGSHNAFPQHNFPSVNYTQPNYVSTQNVRSTIPEPVGSNYNPLMAPPQRYVQLQPVSPQYMSQYNTHSSQNTMNVSVCDRYQQNSCLYSSYSPENYQPSSNICFNSTYHQFSYLQTNTSSTQQNIYTSYVSSENGYFNIQNLPNIQLKTRGLLLII